MTFVSRMTFCWKKFRRFIAAYFTLGLAATIAHGAVLTMSIDTVTNQSESAPTSINIDVSAPVTVPSESPVTSNEVEATPAEDTATPEADSTVSEAESEQTVLLDDVEVTPTDEITTTETDDAVPEVETEPATDTETTIGLDDVLDQAPADTEPISTISDESIDTEADPPPDSWPAERIDTTPETDVPDESVPETEEITQEEPVIEPEQPINAPEAELAVELSPYSETRSTIESVSGKLDWLYTLRAAVDYELLSNTKSQTATNLTALIQMFESQADNSSINSQFCALDQNLTTLNTVLAPDSDNSQPDVDAANLEILTEINDAVTQVRVIWLTASNSVWQCGN